MNLKGMVAVNICFVSDENFLTENGGHGDEDDDDNYQLETACCNI
jgi:hypothetical protein